MENKIRISVLMITAAAWLSACGSGTSQVTAPEADAYEYKGAADPLMAASAADRAGDLASRFDLVQGRQ